MKKIATTFTAIILCFAIITPALAWRGGYYGGYRGRYYNNNNNWGAAAGVGLGLGLLGGAIAGSQMNNNRYREDPYYRNRGGYNNYDNESGW